MGDGEARTRLGARWRKACIGAGATVVGSTVLPVAFAVPAQAAVCTARVGCNSPQTYIFGGTIQCIQDDSIKASVTMPGGVSTVYLHYSKYPTSGIPDGVCRTIWAGSSQSTPWNGGTLVARSYNQGNIYSDSHGNALDAYYGDYVTTMADDLYPVTGFAMGWGTDGQWHKTASY